MFPGNEEEGVGQSIYDVSIRNTLNKVGDISLDVWDASKKAFDIARKFAKTGSVPSDAVETVINAVTLAALAIPGVEKPPNIFAADATFSLSVSNEGA